VSSDPQDDDPTQQTLVTPADKAPSAGPATSSGRFKDPVIGAQVDGYVVRSRLGTGGMGIVYEGEHKVIGKRAAIKVLRPEFSEDPKQLERLVAEARAVNEVGHRGIIDVFGYGQLPDGRQCIVMEYLDGQPLEDVLKAHKKANTKMPIIEVLEVLDEVLSALNAAHSAKVVHRDLKPSNIFMVHQRDARFVKLLDFGIAKLGALGGSTPVSRASMIAGTPTYMAPEQARGAAAAPTMDLYSVGVMAFEMLTNVAPFDADSVVGMLMMHAETPARRPSELNPEVPDALDELVLRLLAKKPEERFKSADHVRAEVVRLKAHLKDPVAHRTLQDDDPMPSVRSEILPIEQHDTMQQPLAKKPSPPKVEVDEEALKQTQYKPLTADPAPAPAPAPAAKNLANETMLVPRKAPAAGPAELSESQQLAVQKSRMPVFLLAAGAGALFVAAGYIALRPAEAPTPQQPVAVKPKPPPPPVAPAPKPETPTPPPAQAAAPELQAAPAEPSPTPPPAVAAPEPKREPPPTPPPAVAAPEPKREPPPPPPPTPKPAVAAAPKPAVAAAPKVAPPPPPPSKSAIAASGLLGRLKKLQARLDTAQKNGTEVALYQKQVQRIREKLEAGPLSPEDHTRVEIALDSLEKNTDY
jgi:serine/threonine-protein kinase